MRTTLSISLVVLLALAGCNQNEKSANVEPASQPQAATQQQASATLTPEELGELGAQIRKNPDRTAELLKDHGMTEKSFEAEIRKITENPEASKRYAEAYKKASA